MKSRLFITALLLSALFMLNCNEGAEEDDNDGTFAFTFGVTFPGTPEHVYDTVTGDISPWWDHSIDPAPEQLYIEPKPGGGFYEIFDESGDGAKHAEVILADRGEILRFTGPLGLTGTAIDLVCTYSFEQSAPDSTTLTLSVHAAGEMQRDTGAIVERVWRHFMFERLKPYLEGTLR